MDKLSKDGSVHYTDESVNTATHMAGALFALFGALLLVGKSVQVGKWWHVASFVVYGFSLVALFVMSSLHHGVNGNEKTNRRLRTLDYVAVYGLIVGTMTPVCLVLYRGMLGGIVLFVAAVAAAFGITMRSIYHTLPSYVSLTLYLCLGWLPALLVLLDRSVLSNGAVLLLILGGMFYSAGAVVYGLEKPTIIKNKFGFHEIWHIAVLLGALCHFIFMYQYVLVAS
jgi:hemolysin III